MTHKREKKLKRSRGERSRDDSSEKETGHKRSRKNHGVTCPPNASLPVDAPGVTDQDKTLHDQADKFEHVKKHKKHSRHEGKGKSESYADLNQQSTREIALADPAEAPRLTSSVAKVDWVKSRSTHQNDQVTISSVIQQPQSQSTSSKHGASDDTAEQTTDKSKKVHTRLRSRHRSRSPRKSKYSSEAIRKYSDSSSRNPAHSYTATYRRAPSYEIRRSSSRHSSRRGRDNRTRRRSHSSRHREERHSHVAKRYNRHRREYARPIEHVARKYTRSRSKSARTISVSSRDREKPSTKGQSSYKNPKRLSASPKGQTAEFSPQSSVAGSPKTTANDDYKRTVISDEDDRARHSSARRLKRVSESRSRSPSYRPAVANRSENDPARSHRRSTKLDYLLDLLSSVDGAEISDAEIDDFCFAEPVGKSDTGEDSVPEQANVVSTVPESSTIANNVNVDVPSEEDAYASSMVQLSTKLQRDMLAVESWDPARNDLSSLDDSDAAADDNDDEVLLSSNDQALSRPVGWADLLESVNERLKFSLLSAALPVQGLMVQPKLAVGWSLDDFELPSIQTRALGCKAVKFISNMTEKYMSSSVQEYVKKRTADRSCEPESRASLEEACMQTDGDDVPPSIPTTRPVLDRISCRDHMQHLLHHNSDFTTRLHLLGMYNCSA